jgi:predicted Ser/Thr protein kinase
VVLPLDPGLADTTPGRSLAGPGASAGPRSALDETRRSGPANLSSGSASIDQRIGRFQIAGEIGRGAMGVVLVAYDELLDRRVALKILHVHDDRKPAEARQMLLREAQALARLAHPNVVTVHECGTFEGEVYVAMEYVLGRDLKAWLAERARGWREVVGVFVQAGAGLLAAHRRGLVHRDFKPSNVLVGDDGRVRVADFGLVASRDRTPASDEQSSGSALDMTIGGAGALVGTPAYLAPELYRQQPASARSDQFAFCVALWEALYGARPFEGKNVQELARALDELALPTSPPRSEVPGWLHAVVLRGLQRRPAERFPSMAELLAALEPRPPSGMMRVAGAAAVAAVVTVLPFLFGRACPDDQELRARVWTEAHGRTIAEGFAREGAPQLGAQVVRRLEGYAGAWAAGAAEACDARRRGGVDPQALDARHQCLERARGRFVALRRELERGGAAVVRNAQSAIDGLPELAACGAVGLADLQCRAGPAQPADREASARGEALLDEAARLELVGDYQGAIGLARAAALRSVDVPGAGARIRARLHLGRLLQESDDPTAALPALLAARDEAERLHCDDVLIDVYDRLLGLAAFHPSIDLGEARGWLDLLALRIEAVGGSGHEDLVRHDRGRLALHREHDLEAAARELHAALRVQQANGATATRRHADTLRMLGLVALGRGELGPAAEQFERAREVLVAATSANEPTLYKIEFNLGLVARARGDWGAARGSFERALALAEVGLGRRSVPVAKCLVTLGSVAEYTHDLAAAVRLAGEAVDIVGEKLPREDPRRVEYLEAYASFLTTAGRGAEAIPWLQEVLVLLADASPGERSWTHLALARAFNRLDDPAAALPHARLAAEHAEDATPGASDPRAAAEFELGSALLDLGRAAEAVPRLEVAVQRWAGAPEIVDNLAHARFALARALCAVGDGGGRAVGLAVGARLGLGDACNGPLRSTCDEIGAWIADGRCSNKLAQEKMP